MISNLVEFQKNYLKEYTAIENFSRGQVLTSKSIFRTKKTTTTRNGIVYHNVTHWSLINIILQSIRNYKCEISNGKVFFTSVDKNEKHMFYMYLD
jgi:hypothetical protein